MTADDARGNPGDLVTLGSGETAQAARSLNHGGAGWRLLRFLDDAPARHAHIVDGLPVLGGRDYLGQLPGTSLVVCPGRPDDYTSRMRIIGDLGLPPERYATIIHPTAAVSASCEGRYVSGGSPAQRRPQCGHHELLLVGRNLGEQRQADDLSCASLSDRKRSFCVTQSCERLGEVNGDGIVNARTDPRCVQLFEHRIPVRDTHHVQVPDVHVPIKGAWPDH